MSFKHLAAVCVALAVSVLPLAALSSDSGISCVSKFQSFSNPKNMATGDFSASVKWKDVVLTDTSVGYGPGEDHRYELTILDGRVYMTRPGKDDSVILRNDPKPDEGAAMLQVVSPKSWGKQSLLPEINSFDDMNFEIDQVVEDLKCGDDVLLPFKITGYAKSVTWSMDTHPSRVTTTEDQKITIVGLYNNSDRSKYFMVKGYNIHPHVVLSESDYAGHLRTVNLDEGAQLYLPFE